MTAKKQRNWTDTELAAHHFAALLTTEKLREIVPRLEQERDDWACDVARSNVEYNRTVLYLKVAREQIAEREEDAAS